MSRSLNKVQLIGNLGSDPDLRSTSNGKRVATLSIATSYGWKDGNGEWQEKTEWTRVILWEKLADVADRFLKKGDKIYIEGRLQTRSWDKDGETRYATEVIGRELIMLGGKNENREPVGADFANQPLAGEEDPPF